MSQRSEKLRRQVARLRAEVDALKETQRVNESFHESLQAIMDQEAAQQAADARRQTRQARREVRHWKWKAMLAIVLSVLISCTALIVTARAVAARAMDTVVAAAEELPVVERQPDEDKPAQGCAFLDLEPLGKFTLTAYCPCVKCCGKDDGITATGTTATEGRTIAVDPSVIPYGTTIEVVYADGSSAQYVAEDCGGAIKAQRLDVFFDSHQAALEFGVQSAYAFAVREVE